MGQSIEQETMEVVKQHMSSWSAPSNVGTKFLMVLPRIVKTLIRSHYHGQESEGQEQEALLQMSANLERLPQLENLPCPYVQNVFWSPQHISVPW